ncbi:MAG: ABC transporter ATP-binding protein/permease [Sphingobacteriales bacterium JAD_PAG50586_3]|nr:MAG: ABC transporter ATP-binding protein/permease [Sphingobacteriales bacterium JAD_PAG50586_3]
MNKFKRLFAYTRPYSKYVWLNIVFNILSVIFGLFTIAMVIPFLRLIFKLEDTTQTLTPAAAGSMQSAKQYFYGQLSGFINLYGQQYALLMLCFGIVTLFFLKNLFRYLTMYFLAPVRNGVVSDLRQKVYNKILGLPLGYFSDERKGDIMSRTTSDVAEVEWSIMSGLEMVYREPLSILITLGMLYFVSPELTITSLVLLPIAGLLIGRLGKTLKKASGRGQSKLGEILSLIDETLGGLRIIKGFTAEGQMKDKFKAENSAFTRLQNTIYRRRDLASPLSEFLGTTVMVILIWIGGSLILQGNNKLNPEEFIFFIALFSQILNPAKALTSAWYNLQKGFASLDRIDHILDAEDTVAEKTNPITITDFEHAIEYKNLSFKYNTKNVLNNINLKIEKGKTIALVGPSGAGKTTLADLLPRFYDCSEGKLLIDGNNVKDLSIQSLRRLIGVVSQETVLFNDSVANNILLGKQGATQAEIEEAGRIANAQEFIARLDGEYNYNIGDRGTKLSGGQRQRLSIARAVLKNPPILILDEATSALDTESEKLVQDALTVLMKTRTSIVIAHRLSTIQNADEIIVLNDGEIVERGTHNELIGKAGLYKRLCDLQAFH